MSLISNNNAITHYKFPCLNCHAIPETKCWELRGNATKKNNF